MRYFLSFIRSTYRTVANPVNIVILLIGLYIIYFGTISTLRIKVMTASYFDLGIMHQTVYNSYQAIKTGKWQLFLALTDPHGSGKQIYRPAIHNDVILGLLGFTYFISAQPHTLLILQTLALASGAAALFLIMKKGWRGAILAWCYLMYPPLQRMNLYEFHGVALATPMLLWLVYAHQTKKLYMESTLWFLILLTKEQAGMAIGTYYMIQKKWFRAAFSIIWSLASVFIIMPYFRAGDAHFATSYFHPFESIKNLLEIGTWRYLLLVFGPTGLMSITQPLTLAPALFDLSLNIFSEQSLMRTTYYHYTAILIPFLFLSLGKVFISRFGEYVMLLVIGCTLFFSWYDSPLLYARKPESYVFTYPAKEYDDVQFWSRTLASPSITVSSTDQLAPYFAGRIGYWPLRQNHYALAQFVVVRVSEAERSSASAQRKGYEQLKSNIHYRMIYNQDGIEVFRRNMP